jgi:hypothetical protein
VEESATGNISLLLVRPSCRRAIGRPAAPRHRGPEGAVHISILRDPATWQVYDNFIVVHSVRYSSELAYRHEIAALVHEERLAASPDRLRYVPVVTQERCPGAVAARKPPPDPGGSPRTRVLVSDEVIVGGVRFLGTTLWTDFRLLDDGAKQAAAKKEAVCAGWATSAGFTRARHRARCLPPLTSQRYSAANPYGSRTNMRNRSKSDGGDHPSCAIAKEHPPALCRLAPERLLRF